MEVSARRAGLFEYYRNCSSAEICTVLFKKNKQNESSNQQFCGQKQLFQADMKHTVSQITAKHLGTHSMLNLEADWILLLSSKNTNLTLHYYTQVHQN